MSQFDLHSEISAFEVPNGTPDHVYDALSYLVRDNAAFRCVLRDTIRTYIVSDEAWDPEADAERIMEDSIRRYYEERPKD